MIDAILRQALEAHNRAISELSIAHAAEVARLKARIKELEAQPAIIGVDWAKPADMPDIDGQHKEDASC